MMTLARMQTRYATCATYEDRGTSMTTFIYDDGREPSTSTLTFVTLFDRARGAFRFEYEEPNRWHDEPTRAVIWRAAEGDASVWWTVGDSLRVVPLETAIAMQTGVSSGTAAMVPLLLLGRAPPGEFTEGGGESASEVVLRRVVPNMDDYEQTLFVAADDGALVKYVERAVITPTNVEPPRLPDLTDEERQEIEAALRNTRPFRMERTVTYDAKFDLAVDPSRFEFIPPLARGP